MSQVRSLGLLLMDSWAGCSMGSWAPLDAFLFAAFDECAHLCGWVCTSVRMGVLQLACHAQKLCNFAQGKGSIEDQWSQSSLTTVKKFK